MINRVLYFIRQPPTLLGLIATLLVSSAAFINVLIPTPEPTQVIPATSSPTNTSTATFTPIKTPPTDTPTPTHTFTSTYTPTPTITPTFTSTPSSTPLRTLTATYTPPITPTSTPTETPISPTNTPTQTLPVQSLEGLVIYHDASSVENGVGLYPSGVKPWMDLLIRFDGQWYGPERVSEDEIIALPLPDNLHWEIDGGFGVNSKGEVWWNGPATIGTAKLIGANSHIILELPVEVSIYSPGGGTDGSSSSGGGGKVPPP